MSAIREVRGSLTPNICLTSLSSLHHYKLLREYFTHYSLLKNKIFVHCFLADKKTFDDDKNTIGVTILHLKKIKICDTAFINNMTLFYEVFH